MLYSTQLFFRYKLVNYAAGPDNKTFAINLSDSFLHMGADFLRSTIFKNIVRLLHSINISLTPYT